MAWDPFEDMEALRREIDRAFEEFGFRTEPFSRVAFLPARGPRRYPLINLHEDRDNLYVEALAPGVDPNSLNLTVVRNNLTLSGEKRHAPQEVKPEAYHRSERAAGKFVRTVELPVEVDESRVSAEYQNGLLVITLPKAEKAKPKQISVRVA
ncbi:MAG TPA: Hsp20/alpha crystallin family protein [Candidatus Acidoferrales bacterium]|nr:Hsp20/alpha crystallin family protein [Candidatus Acidoferrales bacterium]